VKGSIFESLIFKRIRDIEYLYSIAVSDEIRDLLDDAMNALEMARDQYYFEKDQ